MKLWTALTFATLFCAAASAQGIPSNPGLDSVTLDAAKGLTVPSPVISTDTVDAPAAGQLAKTSPEPQMTDEEDTEIDDPQEDASAGINPDQPPVPVNLGGDGSLHITLQRTGEDLTVKYRNDDGTYNQEALWQINHLMRCSLTGRETEMAVKLIELLDAIEDHFGKKGLIVLSGYRSPDLNKTIPWAAKNSRHMLGWACDIRIPGYTAKEVTSYALSLAVGGVGYYPANGFTHVDVGRVRYWVGSSYRRHRRKHGPAHHGKKSSRSSKTHGKAIVAAKKSDHSAALSRKSAHSKTAKQHSPAVKARHVTKATMHKTPARRTAVHKKKKQH